MCEREARWVIFLRREVASQTGSTAFLRRIVAARRAERVFEELRLFPTSAVCWEFTQENAAWVAEQIRSQRDQFPQSLAIAVGEAGVSPWGSLLASAGAMFLCTSFSQSWVVLQIVLRHAATQAASGYPWWYGTPEQTLEDLLPWNAQFSQETATIVDQKRPHEGIPL